MTDFSIYPVGSHDKWKWCVVNSFRVEIGTVGSGVWLEIPSGFVTDLASIPWYARWLVDRGDPSFAKASAIHDWICPDKDELLEPVCRPLWEQRVAAGVFYQALKADGVSLFKRKILFYAVLLASDQW